MLKLIKEDKAGMLYWEVWEDEGVLTVHYGTVGETGETEEIELSRLQNAEKVMRQLAEEKVSEGYEFLDEDDLLELVVQYSYEEGEIETALEKRYLVENLLNECLGWTGNGACDGGDIGSGTINVFNYVVDMDKAVDTVLGELSEHDLLAGLKIACFHPIEEEYVALYPDGINFELM